MDPIFNEREASQVAIEDIDAEKTDEQKYRYVENVDNTGVDEI